MIKFNPVVNSLFTTVASVSVGLLGIGNPVREDLILFTSDIGKSYTGSPRALYEYMRDKGLLNGMDIVWAFTKPEDYQMPGCRVIRHDSIEYFRTALSAKYWVTDVNIERGLRFKRKQTKYLNTWHGSSFKTLGRDIHGRIYYDCSSIDYMCVCSDYDEEIFSRAFGLTKDRFVHTGLPRMDQLHAHATDDSTLWKEKVGLPTDKRVILYAPTWRDTSDGGSSYTISPPIDIAKWRRRLGKDSVLVFRMHPLTQKALGVYEDEFLIDHSRYQPLNDLLLASDCLVTDYSSIAFDYAILKRPCLCFGYDAEEYDRVRGLYGIVGEAFPRGNCATEDEVLDALDDIAEWGEKEYSAPLYTEFNRYGGEACKICAELLLGSIG